MLFNNGKFGEKIKVLIKSIFNQEFVEYLPSPKPDSFLLDDNDADEYYLLDDNNDYLIDD